MGACSAVLELLIVMLPIPTRIRKFSHEAQAHRILNKIKTQDSLLHEKKE